MVLLGFYKIYYKYLSCTSDEQSSLKDKGFILNKKKIIIIKCFNKYLSCFNLSIINT
jgi:hypothetical protein